MTRISKLWQLDALPDGTTITNTRGVAFTIIRQGELRLLQSTKRTITLPHAANSYGPFTITQEPRPTTCCGECPELMRGGYDCTCIDNPNCKKEMQ